MERRGFASVGRRWHRRLDTASGALLLFLLVFAPWGAGGTLQWSSWVMIVTGWTLGGLLVGKWLLVRFTGFEPVRWRREGGESRWPVWAMGGLTVFLLLQVGISLWNARAEVSWSDSGVEFLYRDIVEWLPTTYDLAATRKAFFRYLAFAGVFWAMRDWLRIKSRSERHREEDGRDQNDAGRVPDRLRWLGWTLAVNAALMALVGILHRLDGANELLWMIPVRGAGNPIIFGSFPYRANAAQYLNLVWPLVLGIWWSLRVEAHRPTEKPSRAGGHAYPMLLFCVALMVGGVVVAGSRGGVVVSIVELVFALGLLGRSMKGIAPRIALGVMFIGAVGSAVLLSGAFLAKRFEKILVDDTMSGRTSIFDTAHRIANDFLVWGSGAETFLTVNGLYRAGDRSIWHGYVHDDWLETRATLGIVGLCCSIALLMLAPIVRQGSGRVPIIPEVPWMLGLGFLGMLVHARFDFPFQIPANHLAFLMLLAAFTELGPVRPSSGK